MAVKTTLEDVKSASGMGEILITVYNYLRDSSLLFGSTIKSAFYIRDVDEAGNEAFNTVFGEKTVAERKDTFNIAFQYNNGDGFSTKEVLIGTGSTSNLDERARVHTGVGVGSAQIKSRRAVRYITRHECIAMFTSVYSAPEVNTYQIHVYGENNQDGIGFGYDNEVFGIWLILRGIKVHKPQSEWNIGLPAGFVLNPQTLNIYGVLFGWLGIAPIFFKLFCGKKYGWRTVHVEDLTNMQEIPHLSNASLPISIEVGRVLGTGSDIILSSASWGAGILGSGGAPENRYPLAIRELTNFSNTVYKSIVSFRSKALFEGKTNNIRSILGTVTFSNLGNKDLEIDIFRDNGVNEGTLTGGSFIDYNTTGSPLKYNDGASDFIAGIGSKLVGNTLVQPNTVATRINLLGGKDIELDIVAGETLHIVVLGNNTGSLKNAIRMEDQF